MVAKHWWMLLPAVAACGALLAQPNAALNQAPPGQGMPPQSAPLVGPSPVIHSDGTVTFNLRAPNAVSVKLAGDYPLVGEFHGGRKDTLLSKDDQGNWSVTVGPLKPDFYAYAFEIDGVHFLDPQNAHVDRSSAANRVTNWFIVPGPESADYQVNDVPHGRVSEVWYSSPTLHAMRRRVVVYTPPGYDGGKQRYPVFYLYHGGGEDELTWSILGRAPEILDNLIARQKIVPMIVIMPSFNLNTGFSAADAILAPGNAPGQPPPGSPTLYPDSLVHDLIPFVDKTYRTVADRDHRAVAGTSAGGMQASITGLRHLEAFSWIGLFSPALARIPGAGINIPLPPDADSRRGPDLGVSIDPAKFEAFFPVLNPELNKRVHLLYLSVGGAEGLLEEEQAGRRVLDDKGVKYTWVERPGYGHEWAFWRHDLEDFAPLLFKPAP